MSVEREDIEFLLSEYLDGQLGGRAKAELERRLDADANLREELRRLGSLEGHLGEMGKQDIEGVDYDAHLEDIISAVTRKALLHAPPRRRVLRPVFRVAAVAAGLFVAASVAWLFLRPGPADGEPMADMRILPAAAAPEGPAEVLVTLRGLEIEEVPLDPRPEGADGEVPDAVPPGTVFVSVGPPPVEPSAAPIMYPFELTGGL